MGACESNNKRGGLAKELHDRNLLYIDKSRLLDLEKLTKVNCVIFELDRLFEEGQGLHSFIFNKKHYSVREGVSADAPFDKNILGLYKLFKAALLLSSLPDTGRYDLKEKGPRRSDIKNFAEKLEPNSETLKNINEVGSNPLYYYNSIDFALKVVESSDDNQNYTVYAKGPLVHLSQVCSTFETIQGPVPLGNAFEDWHWNVWFDLQVCIAEKKIPKSSIQREKDLVSLNAELFKEFNMLGLVHYQNMPPIGIQNAYKALKDNQIKLIITTLLDNENLITQVERLGLISKNGKTSRDIFEEGGVTINEAIQKSELPIVKHEEFIALQANDLKTDIIVVAEESDSKVLFDNHRAVVEHCKKLGYFTLGTNFDPLIEASDVKITSVKTESETKNLEGAMQMQNYYLTTLVEIITAVRTKLAVKTNP